MRKIIVLSMITLDGILQAPGAPGEDTSGDFKYGGWVAPYPDEAGSTVMETLMKPADYLLGRKTFEIWEDYWPHHADFWPGINAGKKHVMSSTRNKSAWNNTVFFRGLEDIQELKNTEGSNIQVWGSSGLIHLLLENDLVDELWLKIYPLILGKGKKLFDDGAEPTAFAMLESSVTPDGVIIAHYQRAGKVKTGTVGPI